MSVDIGFYGRIEKDKEYDDMYQVKELCGKMGIPLPDKVIAYFAQFMDYDEFGAKIAIKAPRIYSPDSAEWQITLSEIPEGVKTIIVGMY